MPTRNVTLCYPLLVAPNFPFWVDRQTSKQTRYILSLHHSRHARSAEMTRNDFHEDK